MRAAALAASVVACGGDGGGHDAAPRVDARPLIDAGPQFVNLVTCPDATVDITTVGTIGTFAFSPMSFTTAVNGIVHFGLGATHDVESTTAGQNFTLPFGANACLQFTLAGTYSFVCGPHGFAGEVVVQ